MSDTPPQLETLQLIDRRQQQVLEDLEALNARIENVIELYQHNRKRKSRPDSDSQQDAA